ELGVSQQSTFADLSTAFRARRLELERQKNQEAMTALERVYNLLAVPPLRAAYDELLLDPDRPIEFPGAGFGTLLVGRHQTSGYVFCGTHLIVPARPHSEDFCGSVSK